MALKPGSKTAAEEDSAGRSEVATPERITVALIPKAAADLQRLQERSSLSKTDLVNRSISLYEFIDVLIREGKEVLIRDPEAREIQRIHLF